MRGIPYPARVRRAAVSRVRAGEPPAEVAADYGCSLSALRKWLDPRAAPRERARRRKPGSRALRPWARTPRDEHVCELCGRSFRARRGAGARYCGDRCSRRAYYARHRDALLARLRARRAGQR